MIIRRQRNGTVSHCSISLTNSPEILSYGSGKIYSVFVASVVEAWVKLYLKRTLVTMGSDDPDFDIHSAAGKGGSLIINDDTLRAFSDGLQIAAADAAGSDDTDPSGVVTAEIVFEED